MKTKKQVKRKTKKKSVEMDMTSTGTTCDNGCCAIFTFKRNDKEKVTADLVVLGLQLATLKVMKAFKPSQILSEVMNEPNSRAN